MSQISPLMFFPWEKELLSWMCILKKTPQRTEILISPVWNKILKIWDTFFELIQIEVQCSKNYFKMFLPQEAGAFRNNIEKELQHPRPKLNKYIVNIYREYLLCLKSNASDSFLQKCTNFVEEWLKFSHFEGSIIP